MRERRDEIEAALFTRVNAIADPGAAADPQYAEGLRAAVPAALEHALTGIERGNPAPGPVPIELLAQARCAARSNVSLDVVLRRYIAGHALLEDFVMREADGEAARSTVLRRLAHVQAALLDRTIQAVSGEYRREAEERPADARQRLLADVQALLAGETVTAQHFPYRFESWHLAAVVAGPEGANGLGKLAGAFGCRLLTVEAGGGVVWGWLGGKRRLESAEIARQAADWPGETLLALGEPGRGLPGWRLSHRQAKAALQVALRGEQPLVRYADVAIVASMLNDDLLATSLHELYLRPLSLSRHDGAELRKTVRAYLGAEANASSAANALGVDRHTVAARLRRIEQILGRPLGSCIAEMDAALRFEEVTQPRVASVYPLPFR